MQFGECSSSLDGAAGWYERFFFDNFPSGIRSYIFLDVMHLHPRFLAMNIFQTRKK